MKTFTLTLAAVALLLPAVAHADPIDSLLAPPPTPIETRVKLQVRAAQNALDAGDRMDAYLHAPDQTLIARDALARARSAAATGDHQGALQAARTAREAATRALDEARPAWLAAQAEADRDRMLDRLHLALAQVPGVVSHRDGMTVVATVPMAVVGDSAALTSSGRDALTGVARVVLSRPTAEARVEAHVATGPNPTDRLNTAQARAAAARKALIAAGLDGDRIKAQGVMDDDPGVGPGDVRRIDVHLTVPDAEYVVIERAPGG
jgi:outer membrane protein OmpA-like peptidoglycan-associated protein